MKKLLTIALAAFGLMSVASCTDPNGPDAKPETTCQITNNITPQETTVGADGTLYEAAIIFSDETTKTVGDITMGTTSSKEMAPEGATSVRVSFKLSPTSNTEYTVESFSLTPETANTITITDNTNVSTTKGETKGEVMTLREALSRL